MRRLRIAAVVGFAAIVAFPGASADAQASAQSSRDREIVGHLGITAIECDCTFDARNPGGRDFRFRSNLIIIGVAPHGPSAGTLFTGDTIFEIDAIPLRSRQGGSSFANIRPGQRVTLGLRRAGRSMRVAVTAAGINANDPSGLGQYVPLAPGSADREYDTPPAPPRQPAIPQTPRAVVPPVPAARTPPPTPAHPAAPEVPMPGAAQPTPSRTPRPAPAASTPPYAPLPPVPPSPASPDGWFGFSIRCNECGWAREGTEATPHWESSTPPEIGIVAAGGPADVAGLRSGDRITHVDGASILAPDGARRFGAVTPGQRIRLTVLRDGVSITRAVTLAQRPQPASGRSSLRYTGRLRDVDVQVWSPAGATVERNGDIITINVGGSTVRLKVAKPPARE